MSKVSLNNTVLEEWYYSAPVDSSAQIIPDGCRDIIIEQANTGAIRCFISPLADATYTATISQGTQLLGYRLQPGTSINEVGLQAFVDAVGNLQVIDADCLQSFCHSNASVNEALEGLRSELPGLTSVAKSLGVSVRTLQRHIKIETGKTPQFWMMLVRARRCARRLYQQVPFADAAYLSGYSDQAHMTREMRKWFACTPSSIREKRLLAEIHASGYD
ncbi:MAG: helix-turn-helix domain-containing protein [Pseudomonadales bacterium]|nr:helix-turn-helix domain-containing protein [Pseudomonadales bacterium]